MEENKIIELIKKLDKRFDTLEKKVVEEVDARIHTIVDGLITKAKKEIVAEVDAKINTVISKAKKEIVSEVANEFEKFSNSTSELIGDTDKKIDKETSDRIYEIGKLKNITEYEKLVLRNLESRISILEEESETYRKIKNN